MYEVKLALKYSVDPSLPFTVQDDMLSARTFISLTWLMKETDKFIKSSHINGIIKLGPKLLHSELFFRSR